MAKLYLGTQEVSKVAKKTNVQSLNVTPTTSAQTITATEGTGYSPVNVSAVTSAIDNNIVAGNIKKDVTILGVTGTYGTPGPLSEGIVREVVTNGTYQVPSSSFTFTLPNTASDVGTYAMYQAFYYCSGLTSVDLSYLTKVSGGNAMSQAFYNCSGLTSADLSRLATVSGGNAMYQAFRNCGGLTSVNLSSLTVVNGNYGMQGAFYGCTSLVSIDLSNLTVVSSYDGMYQAFCNCSGLTSVDLSRLTSVSGSYGISSIFSGCRNLTSVNFSNLTTISGSSAMSQAFYNCTSLISLYFPSLSSSSFSSYTNQFNNMLLGCSNVTVSFPASIQSTIGSWSSVTSGFGGTNTTVLFDLG